MGNILKNSQGQVVISGGDALEVTSAIDSNITAANIKKDVTILGVTGTYEGSGGGFNCTNKLVLQGEPKIVIDSSSYQYTFSGELDSAALGILYPGGNGGETAILSKPTGSNSFSIDQNISVSVIDTLFQDKFCEPNYSAPSAVKIMSHKLTFTGPDLNNYIQITDSGLLTWYSEYSIDSSTPNFFIMIVFKGTDGTYDFDVFSPTFLYDD